MYDLKEVEFPVMAGLYHFTARDGTGHIRYDRERLAAWARERFNVELSLDDLRNKQRHEIRALLVDQSRLASEQARQAKQEGQQHLSSLFDEESVENGSALPSRGNGRLESLSLWLREKLDYDLPPEEMARMERRQLEQTLIAAVEDRFRPEMRKMERALLLQILDAAWKDHLLVMDHLRASVGLRGYAQVDPKVEYKREGMRIFETMWESVGQRVTDLIFRMEQLDESFVGSTWSGGEAVHEEAASASEIVEQQQSAIDGTQSEHKPEPIRNRQERVGRNDPCPCGSGKKFKQCCMRKGG